MQLYWIPAQAPRRTLALVKHLKLPVECIRLDPRTGGLKSPRYSALNPNRKAPTLVDGERVLWESSAIMAYLCVKAGSDLWPAHAPLDQVEVLQWLSWADQHWSPAVGPFYFEYVVKKTFGLGAPDPAALEPKLADIRRHAAVLDARLAAHPHPACDRLTIADFQLASMACDWREAHMPLGEFANLVRWLDRLMTLPAWADPWPAA